jgi:oxygen-dependent protoporphyrinogen oxidase
MVAAAILAAGRASVHEGRSLAGSSRVTVDRYDLAVVGAGITGLAAAWEATLAGARVVVLDPVAPGGTIRTTPFDGATLDESADAFLARVPEGLDLCRELGIDGDLVSPTERTARVWSRGELRRLPAEQVLGVPTDLDALAASGIVSAAGIERARADLARPLRPAEGDPTIGAVIRDRLGDEVLERMVDPLVGGIVAGDSDRLSLAATVPQLDAALRSGAKSLIEACAAQRAAQLSMSGHGWPLPPWDDVRRNRRREAPASAPERSGGQDARSEAMSQPPVFFAPSGGMGSLVGALTEAVSARGGELRAGRVRALERSGARWWLSVEAAEATDAAGVGGSSGAAGSVDATAVVVATAAGPAAELLRRHAARAAALLADIPYASVVLVSLAVPREGIERDLDASGYLVPRVEGRLLTACSWTSSKWAHLGGDGNVWLRASAGRDGDPRATYMDDEALLGHLLVDLADTMALRGRPNEVRISRWPSSLAQYRPGHLERVAAVEADVAASAPGVAVAGAWARGVGIPACIRSGRNAARGVLAS